MITKKGNAFVELIGIVLILGIFFLLLFKYYGQTESVYESHYVNPSYEDLEREALVIDSPYAKNDKPASNVFVLNYHVVSKSPPVDDYDISYDQFKAVMFALKKAGYQTVSLDDYYQFMRGEKQLPDKSFLLTFDDAARMSYYNSDPVLKALNYTAVMFVITGFSLDEEGKVYYLNATELETMQQSGRWELQSHGHQSHYRLPVNPQGDRAPALTNKLWISDQRRLETDEEYYARVSADLSTAKSRLEERYGKPITAFALPFGDFGHRASNYPGAHGILSNLTTGMYNMVFYQFAPAKSTDYRANYPDKKQDSYVAVRLSVDALRTPEALLEEIEASRSVELPYQESYTNEKKWTQLSGEADAGPGFIAFTNKTADDSIFLGYLDGSYLWKDYTYSLQIKNNTASSVLLLARFKGASDHVACKFNGKGIGIVRVTGEGQKYVHYQEVSSGGLDTGTNLAVRVQGTRVTCIKNGQELLSGDVFDIHPYGGIGIRIEGFEGTEKSFTATSISAA